MIDPTGHTVHYNPGEPPEFDEQAPDITTNFSSDPTLVLIENMLDLQRFFGSNEPTLGSLNHRLYKDTACGAHISVCGTNREWHHNGENDWAGEVIAIQVGSIVEGSDAEVDGDVLDLPVTVADLSQQIAAIDSEANALWHDANDEVRYLCELCMEIVCNHEKDEHTELHGDEPATYTEYPFTRDA